jgi:hypothetical protein
LPGEAHDTESITPSPPLLRAAKPGNSSAVPQVPPGVTRAAAFGAADAGAGAAPAPASSAAQKAAAVPPASSRHHGFGVRIVMLPFLSRLAAASAALPSGP